MTITTAWQAEIRSLTMGAGTSYGISNIDGLGSPPLRTGDSMRARQSGVRAQLDFYAGRTLVLDFIIEDTSGSIEATVDAWKGAWRRSQDTDIALDLRTSGASARRYFGRPRRLQIKPETMQFGRVEASAEFVATDYRAFSAVEYSETIAVASFSGGMTFPLTFPLTFGSGSSGTVNCDNNGNVESHPILILSGPLTTPSVENTTTGETFTYNDTIPSGSFVEVDLYDRTVLLGGTASRYGKAVGSDWWALDPGDNFIRLNAASGSGTCEITWRDAYL